MKILEDFPKETMDEIIDNEVTDRIDETYEVMFTASEVNLDIVEEILYNIIKKNI